jgi:hypothetical protein
MEKKLEFAENVATVNGKAKSFKRMFRTCDDWESEIYYETKRTYIHEDDGLNFKYKYAVRVEDLYELTGDEDYKGKFEIGLYLVPSEDSMNESVRNRVKKSCGLEEGDRLYVSDIISYGLGACLLSETVSNCRYIEGTKVKGKLAAIANLLEAIDSMRGFYLDRAWNQIGTNGWDVLNEMVNGKDYIQASFDRLGA